MTTELEILRVQTGMQSEKLDQQRSLINSIACMTPRPDWTKPQLALLVTGNTDTESTSSQPAQTPAPTSTQHVLLTAADRMQGYRNELDAHKDEIDLLYQVLAPEAEAVEVRVRLVDDGAAAFVTQSDGKATQPAKFAHPLGMGVSIPRVLRWHRQVHYRNCLFFVNPPHMYVQIYLAVPHTYLAVPQIYLAVPQIYLPVPYIYLAVPQIYLAVPHFYLAYICLAVPHFVMPENTMYRTIFGRRIPARQLHCVLTSRNSRLTRHFSHSCPVRFIETYLSVHDKGTCIKSAAVPLFSKFNNVFFGYFDPETFFR